MMILMVAALTLVSCGKNPTLAVLISLLSEKIWLLTIDIAIEKN
jgi:hypothetical protein